MKINCNVIRDLLPLYADQICSNESKELVDEHLAQCRDCSALLQQIQNTTACFQTIYLENQYD